MADPIHSPLGASSFERWSHCAGSVELLKQLKLPESDAPDYQLQGTAAHDFLAQALEKNLDGWEFIGEKHVNGVECDQEMADAIQVYLDTVRPLMTEGRQVLVETGVGDPTFHRWFYGTVDCAVITPWSSYEESEGPGEFWLDVNDFKYGKGVVVDVKENGQVMYYAYGILRKCPWITHVRMRIVQPRVGYLPNGGVSVWEIDAEYVRDWAESTLLPAMERTAFDQDLDAGKWCRFCPAKLVCPVMTDLFKAAMQSDPKRIVDLSDESLDMNYQYRDAVKQYVDAMEKEVARRLNTGLVSMKNAKLVAKKADRVWKPEAKMILEARFGPDIYTAPELKSPPQIEALGADAKKLTKEWAYTPFLGVTVAPRADKRQEVVISSAVEAFPNAAAIASGDY